MNKNALLSLFWAPAVVLAWSPSGGYAPGIVECPSYLNESSFNDHSHAGFLRLADDISPEEITYMEARDNLTFASMKTFLAEAGFENFDSGSFMDKVKANSSTSIPRLALAFSGGGYRAMLAAAGEIAGLDNRTIGTNEHGLPLLDAASYISGLSGGSWFVSSLVYNNWTSVQEIVDQTYADSGNAIWQLNNSILAPAGNNTIRNGIYWKGLYDDTQAKKNAGFDISITDPWGRGLSHQFFPSLSDAGAAMLFSDVQDYPIFRNQSIPFPIVVADGRQPGTLIINSNSTIFEFNPFEMGSWDSYVESFVDLKYAGTEMDGGKVAGNGSCWSGLDNTGFVFGTSSTLFNQFLLQLNTTSLNGSVYETAHGVLSYLEEKDYDVARWYPNPFYNSPFGSSDDIKNNDTLFLVDGGEDLQNVPLWPLLQQSREVDAILAFDNSGNSTELFWPTFTSLSETYQRQFYPASNKVAVPYMPDYKTMVHLNLTAHPTFFGCYAKNLTSLMADNDVSVVPPLIIAIANRPWSFNSNTSTFKLQYDDEEKLDIIRNGFEVSTFNNLTIDTEFRKCVGCALIQRSKERIGEPIGDECQKCFDRYCWDGTLYDEDKDGEFWFSDVYTDWGSYNSSIAEEEGIVVSPSYPVTAVVSTSTSSNSSSYSATTAVSTSTGPNSSGATVAQVSTVSSKSKNDAADIVGVTSIWGAVWVVIGLLV